MADNVGNYTSTPEGYATPDQIKSVREYAKALLMGSGQQPVKHWSQGVSNMVSALVGGGLDWNAAQREKRDVAMTGQQQAAAVPGQNYATEPVGSLAPAIVGPNAGKRVEGEPDLDKSGRAIAGMESSNNYAALGPLTKTGDRAYGKYQVMGNNVPEWTKVAYGRSLTPDEFLNDKGAQEAVFKHKFGEYTQKYGPEGAARAWFAGEDGMNNPNAKDILGTTVAGYGKKFASAFNGPDNFSNVPAVKAMSSALRGDPAPTEPTTTVAGDPQVAAAKPGLIPPSGGGIVGPSGNGTTFIDPRLVKPQAGFTQEQFQNLMSNPWLSQEDKRGYMGMMLNRGQTVTMDAPGGMGKVMIDPNNPNVQQYIQNAPHFGKVKTGDIEREEMISSDKFGNPIRFRAPRVTFPTPGSPRSEVAPTGGAGEPSGPPVVGNSAVSESAPAAPAVAPEGGVQVASLDPAAGVGAPGAEPVAPGGTKVAASEGAATPLTRLQGLKAPPGVDQEDWDANTALSNQKLQHELEKEAGTKSIDAGLKKYDTLTSQASTARKLMPQIALARSLMDDPNFRGGWGSAVTDELKRMKEALLGDKFANASNEAFDKLMAGNVLDTMKTALGGLGQVRLAEIDLLNRANGNRTNTAASNKAILEISKRGLEKLDNISGLANAYMSGDEVVDPVTGKTLLKANMGTDGEIAPRRTLDSKFEKIARQYDNDHPSFTPEEIKNYHFLFEGKDSMGQVLPKEGATAPVAGPAVGTIKTFPDGKGGTVEGVWDGKKWGPK